VYEKGDILFFGSLVSGDGRIKKGDIQKKSHSSFSRIRKPTCDEIASTMRKGEKCLGVVAPF